jgi:hypothetical protein
MAAIEKPISELLNSIDSGEYLIPEFQRGYVWNAEQVKGFVRSLYLGYPTGSFLIWKTQKPSEIRGNNVNPNYVEKQLVLDGQQRLTTIYTIFKGKTPIWYEGVSLRTDLYFNLDKEEFQYFRPREMEGKREWLHVSSFLVGGGLMGFMSKIGTLQEDDRNYYLNGHNLPKITNLGKMIEYGYYIKEIRTPEVEKVVEIFNLVNKSGTTLSESDLALAVICSTWDGTKERLRKQIAEYAKANYKLDFNFFSRLLNMLTTDQAVYRQISKQNVNDFEQAWDKINRSLPYLMNILREDAYIDSNENLSTIYVIFTLVYYLSKNNNKFPSEQEKKKAIYWLFIAQLWGWYSGASESYLEKDINAIKQGKGIDGLIENITLFRGGNLHLTPNDLTYQGVRSKIYSLFYAVIRSQNAKDWTDINVPLYSRNLGFNNALERHHVFPKAFLRKKYNPSNTIHKSLINEIANIALITQKSNIEILDGAPSEYLPKIDQEQLRKQFIPTESALYDLENFELFLEKRRKLIADGINSFLNSFFEYSNPNKIASDIQHLDDAIERIETALRDKIDFVLNEACEIDPVKELIPSHIQKKLEDKINAHLARNPGEDASDYKHLRAQLNFFDINEYKETITNKTNWDLFDEYFGKPGVLEQKFYQLGELRNCIRHSRTINEVTLKEGEAAIVWFESILLVSKNT